MYIRVTMAGPEVSTFPVLAKEKEGIPHQEKQHVHGHSLRPQHRQGSGAGHHRQKRAPPPHRVQGGAQVQTP